MISLHSAATLITFLEMKIKVTLLLLAIMLNSGCMIPFLLLEELPVNTITYDDSYWDEFLDSESTVVLAKAVNNNGYMEHEFVAFIKNDKNKSQASVRPSLANYSADKDEKGHYTIYVSFRRAYRLKGNYAYMGGYGVSVEHIMDDLREKKIITSKSNR